MKAMTEARVIAIDFARFGGDESCIVVRQGHAITKVKTFARTEPTEVVRYAFMLQRKLHWTNEQCMFIVDATGMGQGVLGMFHEKNKRVFEFHNAGSASKADYANKITEAYFNVRELVRQRRLHLPEDREFLGGDPKSRGYKPPELVMEKTIEQLSSRLYSTNPKGKLILETKDQYMERMVESPDRGDAIAMACYQGCTLEGRSA